MVHPDTGDFITRDPLYRPCLQRKDIINVNSDIEKLKVYLPKQKLIEVSL